MTELLLGVDVGTQMTKGVLCEPDGRIVASAQVAHGTRNPQPGWYEQDADAAWWGDFCSVTQTLLFQADVSPPQIAGVGCSAMTPNMLPLDRHGEPVRSALLYRDNRSKEVYPEILEQVSEEAIFEMGGFPLRVHGGWQGAQLLWLRRHQPELYRQTAKVVGTTNYLVYKLTGEFVADYALARCNIPFYDQHRRYWSEERCGLLNVPMDLFPERIGHSTEIAGTVQAEAARACGLAEGTPVIFGAMDTNADMVAAGVTVPGDVGLVYGTSLIVTKCLSEPCASEGALSNDYVVPGRFLCGAGVQTGGAIVSWFRDRFGFEEREAEAAGGPDAFEALADLAATVPAGADRLLVIPRFGGERAVLDGRLASGTVLGLSLFHTRAHLCRAILEGTAYEARRQLRQLAPEVPVTRIRSVGGGTQNRVWTQILTNVLGIEQRCFPETSGAPYGVAYLAGLGVGLFADFEPLTKNWVRGGYGVSLVHEEREAYERMYYLYCDALEMLGLDGSGALPG